MSSSTRQTHVINIGQNHIVAGTNNTVFNYPFKRNMLFGNNGRIALCKFIGYNSIKNISASQQNNTFQIVWYDAGGAMAPITVTIPDGNYSFADLNLYLQYICIQNSLYLIDAAGDYVYYLEFPIVNQSAYKCELRSYPIPTALPGGYTAPPGWPGYPAVATTPQIIIPAGGFATLTGFTAGTYPAVVQASNYEVLGTDAPQIDPNATFNILCNMVNNEYTDPTSLLYAIAVQGAVGEQYIVAPPEFAWASIPQGSYSNIQIRLVNAQTNFPINISDPNMNIMVVIES